MNTVLLPKRTNAAGTMLPIGRLLRSWRERRHLSQIDLANAAEISPRHISFLETGRSAPSRAMLLRLSERLDIPLRERNTLLLSAGYAPMYSERPFDDPALSQARAAVEMVIAGHEPYPAVAVDRHWTVVSANAALRYLLKDLDPTLLEPPVNVLRLALHPKGLAPRVENYAQLRVHLLSRLRRQIDATADPVLADLLEELAALPSPATTGVPEPARDEADYGGVGVPLRIRTEYGVLAFFGTVTVFGTPIDVTLAELAIESFFPADTQTAEVLGHVARRPGGPFAKK
jgi:transcriptional regulator with XRE-family HTH domain